ncbi:MAG: DNA polymerase I [Chloroflexi bacterium]|nr:DNA polymerase I [Chloroflexota bacterium]
MALGETTSRPMLVLIDGFALIFRAYHGMTALTTSTGEPVGAVFGFTRMLLDVLQTHQPEYILLTLDSGPTFRHDEYAEYKAHRPVMPDDFQRQVVRVKEVVDALNIPIYQLPGYEADDVIGTMARQAPAHGLQVLILTGDRDLLQVVAPAVEVLTPSSRSFSDAARRFDEAEVMARYGFSPALLPDYKALTGDTSDNIPGVPGIGDKTAKALITAYGPLEAVLDHVDDVTPKRAQAALREHAELARRSKRLATIVTDLPIVLELERCHARDFDRERVVRLFRELEFRSLLARLPDSTRAAAPVAATAAGTHEVVRTEAALVDLVARLRGQPFAVDTEADALDPINAALVGISLAHEAGHGYYLPVGHRDGSPQLSLDAVRRHLGPLLADSAQPKIAHHAKYDLLVLENAGITLAGVSFDTMIAAYLLGASSVGLKDLAFKELGREMVPIEELIGRGKSQITMAEVATERAAAYAADDACCTMGLAEVLAPRLDERGLRRLMDEIEMPLVPVLARIERWGVAVDVDYLQELAKLLELQIRQLEARIHALAGHPFNINSPQQLSRVLFEELGLKGGRKTATGFSTASEILEALAPSHEIVSEVLGYRQLVKLKGTYVDSLPLAVNARTGRIHTSFSQTTASTGRLASLNPNLQNIPIRTEVGREVRRAFIADRRPEWRLAGQELRLVSVDYSQIELRVLAHMCGDERLVEAFREGLDIHRATAAELYGVPLADVTGDMRRIAKTVNFGLIYAMSAFGLARDTGLSQREAVAFIDTYRRKFARVFDYMARTRQEVAERGYAMTLLGRRRWIPEINSANPMLRAEAERMAINAPIQGTAADMMKLAMIEMDRALRDENLHSRMLLQVHDELLFEAPISEVERLAAVAARVMSQALPLSVPVLVEAKVGLNWDEMTPLAIPSVLTTTAG